MSLSNYVTRRVQATAHDGELDSGDAALQKINAA